MSLECKSSLVICFPLDTPTTPIRNIEFSTALLFALNTVEPVEISRKIPAVAKHEVTSSSLAEGYTETLGNLPKSSNFLDTKVLAKIWK